MTNILKLSCWMEKTQTLSVYFLEKKSLTINRRRFHGMVFTINMKGEFPILKSLFTMTKPLQSF